ncbi:MAG: DmsC/YnfH family molybdoenzyme membrane anchor subunit [bacterium]
MASRLGRRTRQVFHEAPLVLFSTLASVSCGIGAAWWAVLLEGGAGAGSPRSLAALAALFMGAALLFSLLHLGRPPRMFRAVTGLGTSCLSWEVLFASGFFLLAGGGWILPAPAAAWSWLASCCAALAFFAAMGQVYRLRGQLTWTYRTSAPSFILGAAAGAVIIHLTLQGSEPPGLAVLLLVLDLLLLLGRWRWYGTMGREGRPAHPILFAARSWLLGSRAVLADFMPLLYLLAPGGEARTAAFFLITGLFADRFVFYALAVRRSTASEVARVGHLIRHLTP